MQESVLEAALITSWVSRIRHSGLSRAGSSPLSSSTITFSLYQDIIEGLGDFTMIRSPAKCAARRTGFLKEGEIFCSVVDDRVIQPIVGAGLIISRCPALHPGDVQLVNAVLPPTRLPTP